MVTVQPMTHAFAAATAVTPVDGAEPGVQHYLAEIQPGWDIGGNANGGYLMAIAGRAMAEAVGRPPLTLTAHFLRPGPAGACTVDVQPVRIGRRLATARATLSVGDKPTLELLGTFGEQRPDPDGPHYAREQPADVPPYPDCAPTPEAFEGVGPALMDRLACRLKPGDDGFRHGAPTGDPQVSGWFALAHDEPIDSIGLLLAVDPSPPPVLCLRVLLGGPPSFNGATAAAPAFASRSAAPGGAGDASAGRCPRRPPPAPIGAPYGN